MFTTEDLKKAFISDGLLCITSDLRGRCAQQGLVEGKSVFDESRPLPASIIIFPARNGYRLSLSMNV